MSHFFPFASFMQNIILLSDNNLVLFDLIKSECRVKITSHLSSRDADPNFISIPLKQTHVYIYLLLKYLLISHVMGRLVRSNVCNSIERFSRKINTSRPRARFKRKTNRGVQAHASLQMNLWYASQKFHFRIFKIIKSLF